MKVLLLFLSFVMSGCLILLDDDCDLYDPDYSHTEYDCYYSTERVDVCNRHYCWEETRDVRVCDEYYVCYDGRGRSR